VDHPLIASLRWGDPTWQADALGWVEETLDRVSRPLTGRPEQTHRRPWSTVFRCPTSDGPVWFKAMARGEAFEVPLLMALARWHPDRVLAPLAADVQRAWMLLPDGGTTLRNAQAGSTPEKRWAEILTEHAEFQRACAARADELVALGVPDLRPDRLPALRDELLAGEEFLMIGHEDGMTRGQLGSLRADATRYAGWCSELADTGVPASLQHDDLHDANVFVPGERGGHYRVFDWGDSSVAHPFAVLLVALRVVAHVHKAEYGAPELLRLRDAYLEPWSADFDRPTLLEAVRLALRTGGVSRARAYRVALLEGTEADVREHGDGLPYWLLEMYGPTPVEPDHLEPASP
jgi:hypothetical protein